MERAVLVAALCALMSGCLLLRGGQRYRDFTTPSPLARDEFLVLGFMGGRQPWNNEREGTRKLALKLRAMNLPGVHLETVENRKRGLALQLILNALDRDRDGQLSEEERTSVHLIIYGQSFGGAAVVKMARQLQEKEIPVLLTVQIDSVGRNDAVIPSNVRFAANLHQQDGWFVRGEKEIRPEDSDRTVVLGNFQFSYKDKKIDLSDVPWHKTIFRLAHARMDRDPRVWDKVEQLILEAIEQHRKSLGRQRE